MCSFFFLSIKRIVIFLGYSGSGKTFALTAVARELTKRKAGRIGTFKHVHDPEFTIDTRGKDTWRHAASGASLIVALAQRELAMIRRGGEIERTVGVDEILDIFRREGIDFVLVEGLYRRFLQESSRRDRRMLAVLCARTREEVDELLEMHKGSARVICITGRGAGRSMLAGASYKGIPVLVLPRGASKMVDLITLPTRRAKQKTNIRVKT